MLTARSPHWFPSVTKQGVSAIFQTERQRHVPRDPARRHAHRARTTTRSTSPRSCARLAAKRAAARRVMIDCSHGNSHKDHRRQADVAGVDLRAGRRRARGSIFGAMLESHLVDGRQDYVPGRPPSTARASPTRACRSIRRSAARGPRAGAADARIGAVFGLFRSTVSGLPSTGTTADRRP